MSRKVYIILFIITLICFIAFQYFSLNNLVLESDSSRRSLSKLIVEVIVFFLLWDNGINRRLTFWVFWIAWLIIDSIFGSSAESGISRYIYLWFPQAAFIAGFYFERHHINIRKWLTPATIIMMIIVINFMITKRSLSNIDITVRGGDNIIFYLVCLIPFILFFKNFSIKTIAVIICAGMSIFSLKRSSMIMMGLILIFYFYNLFKRNHKNKFQYILIAIVIFAIGYNSVLKNASDSLDRSFDRMEQLSDDGGSNRDILWQDIIKAISHRDFIDNIFGSGPNSTMRVAHHTSGHNDALTLMLEQGLIGIIFYCIFLFRLLKFTYKLHKYYSKDAIIADSICIIVLCMGMFSNLVPIATYFTFLTFALGILEGQDYNRTRRLYVSNHKQDIRCLNP